MRTLNRIKKQKRPFTTGHFYIHLTNGIYQFRDRETHMVISTAGSLVDIKRCILLILNRYKHYDNYLLGIRNMSEQSVTEKQKVEREKEYKKTGNTYLDVIDTLLKEYYIEFQEIEDRRRTPLPAPVHTPVVTPNIEVIPPVRHTLQRRRSRL